MWCRRCRSAPGMPAPSASRSTVMTEAPWAPTARKPARPSARSDLRPRLHPQGEDPGKGEGSHGGTGRLLEVQRVPELPVDQEPDLADHGPAGIPDPVVEALIALLIGSDGGQVADP